MLFALTRSNLLKQLPAEKGIIQTEHIYGYYEKLVQNITKKINLETRSAAQYR